MAWAAASGSPAVARERVDDELRTGLEDLIENALLQELIDLMARTVRDIGLPSCIIDRARSFHSERRLVNHRAKKPEQGRADTSFSHAKDPSRLLDLDLSGCPRLRVPRAPVQNDSRGSLASVRR
jgi:hypothetical protein